MIDDPGKMIQQRPARTMETLAAQPEHPKEEFLITGQPFRDGEIDTMRPYHNL